MQFFIALYTNWFPDYSIIEKIVLEAERLGYDGVLMPDHYMFIEEVLSFRPDANHTLEAWIALTYLAAKTERIQLGTLVSPIPLRPPGVLAKMATTLDVLSNGRVIVGIGAGWSQVEFEGYSEWDEPKVRVDKTQEGVELMRRLWTEDEVTFDGKYYQAKSAVLEPKPVQKPYPPLLFGGHENRMLALAGQYADIAFISTARRDLPDWEARVDHYRRAKEKVMKAAKKHNREKDVAFMFGGFTLQTIYQDYDTAEYSLRVQTAADFGAKYFLTPFPGGRQIESMQQFAKEIMPSFK
jgi:alkanesulfonate monooxygenase SsuD/methylene tetrahydromethanopterin reductase-like flavin-dependent oxidoreductase (luciferase family)